MIHTPIIQEAKKFVTEKFQKEGDDRLAYHNINHTRQVAAAVTEIARNSDLTDEEEEMLMLAAWFHDLGYTVQKKGHEELGRQMAVDFLSAHSYPQKNIRIVGNCIMATKMPQAPENELEKILCDADMLHLADITYMENLKKLRSELEEWDDWTVEDEEWLVANTEFLSNHRFFTDYAREKYAPGVQRSIQLVQDELKKKRKGKKI